MSSESTKMQPLEQNAAANVPAFLGKLWNMVNDPATDNLICWSKSGDNFIIQNKAQFWYELLPLYYKHNNMSSFVRQLNMYGFHKLSTIENGTMDIDKDETQFSHPLFKKDKPQLLHYIKRKVTAHKPNENINQNVLKHEDIAKVLTDVKQLKGRQSTVDTQLAAMKQENAVLWRELALLRQKHMKQQQIVNKLIQFLVTLAHNQTTRIGVGVKRRMPLMINESPSKKAALSKSKKAGPKKTPTSNTGPTIHEIENQGLPDDIFEHSDTEPIVLSLNMEQNENENKKVNSPATPASSTSSHFNIPSPQSVLLDDTQGNAGLSSPYFDDFNQTNLNEFTIPESDIPEVNLENLAENYNNNVFLNPASRDTLLSNITNGNYNFSNVNNAKTDKKNPGISKDNDPNMAVATRINGTRTSNPSRDDLDVHLENSQSELESLKNILSGCTSFDANTLLGLFNEETPNYGLGSYNQEKGAASESDSLLGSELATIVSNPLDFNQLFEYALDDDSNLYTEEPNVLTVETSDYNNSGSINTPQVVNKEPFFKN